MKKTFGMIRLILICLSVFIFSASIVWADDYNIALNNGAAYTKSRKVTLKITAPKTSKFMISTNGNFGTKWNKVTSKVSLTLPSSDGQKTVSVKFKDAQGIEKVLTSDIILDTQSPVGSVSINAGAKYSNNKTLSVDLACQDASPIKFQYSSGSSWSKWQELAESFTLTFTKDGKKTIQVKFSDAAGNISKTYSSSITIDTILPSGSIKLNNGSKNTSKPEIPISISAKGAYYIQLSTDGINWTAQEPFSTKKIVTLSENGENTIYVKLIDLAGNEFVLHDTIAYMRPLQIMKYNVNGTAGQVLQVGERFFVITNRNYDVYLSVINKDGSLYEEEIQATLDYDECVGRMYEMNGYIYLVCIQDTQNNSSEMLPTKFGTIFLVKVDAQTGKKVSATKISDKSSLLSLAIDPVSKDIYILIFTFEEMSKLMVFDAINSTINNVLSPNTDDGMIVFYGPILVAKDAIFIVGTKSNGHVTRIAIWKYDFGLSLITESDPEEYDSFANSSPFDLATDAILSPDNRSLYLSVSFDLVSRYIEKAWLSFNADLKFNQAHHYGFVTNMALNNLQFSNGKLYGINEYHDIVKTDPDTGATVMQYGINSKYFAVGTDGIISSNETAEIQWVKNP